MADTGELLFEYLKNILYAPEKASLDPDTLPEEFRKLGMGLQFLEQCLREERRFGKALARGDLDAERPDVENILASPLVELQGALRHLAWQTKQVAKGDYQQRVDFMGDFSEAFNTMTRQLEERQEALLAEKKLVEEKNEEITRTLNLLLSMTNYVHHMIWVLTVEDKKQIWVNQTAEWFEKTCPKRYEILMQRLRDEKAEHTIWDSEITLENGLFASYSIESFSVSWMGEPAMVHVVTEDTRRKEKEYMMYRLAYVDPLTGLSNRRHAWEQMEQWVAEHQAFTMAMVDVDYLKYCNDVYGHKTGDEYLKDISNALKATGCDANRVGGDEFLLLSRDMPTRELGEMLEEIRSVLAQGRDDISYPRSFSYAICRVPQDPAQPLDSYIRWTDAEMYRYKRQHKEKLSGDAYIDDRI